MYVRHIQGLAHNEHSINVTQYCHQIKKGQSTVSQSTFRACSSDFLTREGFTRKTENRSYIYMVSKYLTTSYLLITKGGSCNFIAETWRKHFTQVIKENLINTGTKSGSDTLRSSQHHLCITPTKNTHLNGITIKHQINPM